MPYRGDNNYYKSVQKEDIYKQVVIPSTYRKRKGHLYWHKYRSERGRGRGARAGEWALLFFFVTSVVRIVRIMMIARRGQHFTKDKEQTTQKYKICRHVSRHFTIGCMR